MNQSETFFDLTEAQIRAVLTDAAGIPVAEFTPRDSAKTENGVSGEVRRVTLDYRNQAGEAREFTLYVKRCLWKGRSEAVHYRYLAEWGVPTPRLYGTGSNSRGEEVIFLEPLTAIGFRTDSEAEWRGMLTLLARFNACPITPDYASHLHAYEQIGQVGGGLWISGFDPQPTPAEVENGWEVCDVPSESRLSLTQAAHSLFARVAGQPTGLLHQDFMPDNFGWRGDRAEMVVFDLHKNACGPRFADVAPYLAVPDWSKGASFLDSTGADGVTLREVLTQHYLDEYARFGGPCVTPDEFRAETTDLFWAHKVTLLPWLAEQGHVERVQETLDFLLEDPTPNLSPAGNGAGVNLSPSPLGRAGLGLFARAGGDLLS